MFNHSVCSGHDTSFNRSSFEDNYLTAAVSIDRHLSYANILPSRDSGNENNVISLSVVFLIETMKLLSCSEGGGSGEVLLISPFFLPWHFFSLFLNKLVQHTHVMLGFFFLIWAVESLRRETTEGQWPKKRKTSPTRRHKRNRSIKSKESMETATEKTERKFRRKQG